jgi:hypothetical protein
LGQISLDRARQRHDIGHPGKAALQSRTQLRFGLERDHAVGERGQARRDCSRAGAVVEHIAGQRIAEQPDNPVEVSGGLVTPGQAKR